MLRRFALVHCSFADHLGGLGEFRPALGHYHMAIEADPDYELSLFNLALLLATCRDEKLRRPEEAVWLAERACSLVAQPDAPQLLILTAAYAEAGRFHLAAETARRAIPLAQAAGDAAMTDDLRRRFEHYRDLAGGKSSSD